MFYFADTLSVDETQSVVKIRTTGTEKLARFPFKKQINKNTYGLTL